MADRALTEPWIDSLALADTDTYLEQRIFARSPLSWATTSVLLFVVLLGAYAGLAILDQVPLITPSAAGYALEPRARLAAILALVICVALAAQRYARIKDCEDAPAMKLLMRADTPPSMQIARPMPNKLKLWRATIAGIAVGSLLSVVLFWRDPGSSPLHHPLVFAWLTTELVVLISMFARGVELSRAGAEGAREVIARYLVIDLLRIDLLSGWGRAAARTALVWFAVSAAGCLLFMGKVNTLYTIGLLVACAAMGVWVFVGTMTLVHRKIREAKHAELTRLRSEIEALWHRAHLEADAALKLQGLLALEARIEAAQEWPFDQTIAFRVGASALILTLPWFGQAVAGTLVERIGQFLH